MRERIRARCRAAVGGALLLAWAAPSNATPRMPTHIACVGDSITLGAGSSGLATNYPSQLGQLLGGRVKVGNFGQAGATLLSTGDLPYVQTQNYTDATNFAGGPGGSAVVDVIILLGTNDSVPTNWTPGDAGTRAGQFALDLAAMVDHFSTLPTHPVIYLALPLDAVANTYGVSGAVIHDQIIPIINQVAAEKGAPVIDLNTPTMGLTADFTDGVHPNDSGYALVAGVVRDGLMRVPSVSLLSPTSDMILPPHSTIFMAGEAQAGQNLAITNIEFFAGRKSLRKIEQPPYMLDWAGGGGTYVLTATATDTTGASATTAPVTVVVQPTLADRTDACACHAGGRQGGAGALAVALLAALVARRRRRK